MPPRWNRLSLRSRYNTTLVAFVAALALLLTEAGYMEVLRIQSPGVGVEIRTRIALGAKRERVLRLRECQADDHAS